MRLANGASRSQVRHCEEHFSDEAICLFRVLKIHIAMHEYDMRVAQSVHRIARDVIEFVIVMSFLATKQSVCFVF